MTPESALFTKADLIASFLMEREVPAIFELSGGMIAFITDAVARLGKTPIVNARHEQAAGFAAEGATRVTGRSAVAMGTSGPGATNLITAIASSYFDSVPTVFITGQVNQKELKESVKQRQNGFQELDIVQAVQGITKYAVAINSKSNLLGELQKAWKLAHEGRPGPVLLDIPIDVQQELSTPLQHDLGEIDTKVASSIEEMRLDELLNLVTKSERPLFLLGGGVRTSNSAFLLREIVDKWKLPAVYSLMAIDVLESSSPYRIGMIGSYGNRWANRAIAQADLVIALGTRLDIRQTGPDPMGFIHGKKIFRVDADEAEINGRIHADISVNLLLQRFIEVLAKVEFRIDRSKWLASIKAEQAELPQKLEQPKSVTFNPDEIMQWISSISKHSNGYVVDVGQHQMWAAQSLRLEGSQRLLTSGGLGAMGFALPAAIGASFAKDGRWIVIAGDGCTQLSIAELQTVRHYNLPITLCIVNNGQHGMVAQFQETNMNGRYTSTRDGYSTPNFQKVAQAFGIESRSFTCIQDLKDSAEFVSQWDDGPLILEFELSLEAKALPKMGMGSSIQDL
jgi:acetolactate synthase-1/2/3 large subunit